MSAATKARTYRTFLLMREFAAREIGERIALARKEAGAMTQEQLAELLNVSTRSVQDYEAGVTIPWKHFERLETVFEKDLGWFLRGEEAAATRPDGDVAARLDRIEEQLARLEEMLQERRHEPPTQRSVG